MTTSGTYSFNPTTEQMITMSYRRLGVIAEEEVPTAAMYQDALFALNSMIKEWDASGIHVWTTEEGILFLQPYQNLYYMGTGSTDHYAYADSWYLLTLTASANPGATDINVDDASDVTSGDNIGVVLDDGTTWWDIVNGAPVQNGTTDWTITLTTGLPATSGASQNNYAFDYTSNAQRPLRVPFARTLFYNGLIANPMTRLSHQEYQNLPQKTNTGTTTQWFYQPTLVKGKFYVWPVPNNSTFGVRYTWLRQIQDFDTLSNTSDLPQEWVNAIVWNLARELNADFDIPEARWNRINAMAMEKLQLVQGFDREPEPVYFGLSYDQTHG